MRWTPGGISRNVEDRRGMRRVGIGGGLGLGGLLLALAISWLTGENPSAVVNNLPLDPSVDSRSISPEDDRMAQFVSFVLDDAQAAWARVLPAQGAEYSEAKLVLFRDAVDSGCGFAQSATGPFYCPSDQKVYIDLSFFEELSRRFGAPGDFAQAYVLAHEIGHHVQTLLGIEREVRGVQQSNPRAANQLSVRMELQADCFAGIWGHSTQQRDILERGDVEEALNAAAAIGDDRLQRQSTGRVAPDSFTHGSSAQRVEWFRRGLNSGRVQDCDTFASAR
jgi:uncharacterized protein